MNIIDGPAIQNLCDYDFGDQAGCLGGVPKAFMEDASWWRHRSKYARLT